MPSRLLSSAWGFQSLFITKSCSEALAKWSCLGSRWDSWSGDHLSGKLTNGRVLMSFERDWFVSAGAEMWSLSRARCTSRSSKSLLMCHFQAALQPSRRGRLEWHPSLLNTTLLLWLTKPPQLKLSPSGQSHSTLPCPRSSSALLSGW